jgi:PAS domain S-box-containing protein
MDWVNLIRLLLFVPPVISTALAIYVWQLRPLPGAAYGAFTLGAAAWWCLSYALQLGLGADLAAQLWWAKLRQIGVVTTVPLVLLAALAYTDRARSITPMRVGWLALIPALTLIGVFTNESHGLYWRTVQLDTTDRLTVLAVVRGPLSYVNIFYSYVILLWAAALLVRWGIVHYRDLYRGQAFALAVSVLAPWVTNFVYLAGLSRVDPTPYGLTLGGISIVWAFLGYQVLGLRPMARDTLIENMSDGVLVVDRLHRVIDYNPAFLKILGVQPETLLAGQPVDQVWQSRPDLAALFVSSEALQTEIELGDPPQRKTYDMRISPIADPRTQMTGHLIVLRDITARKQTENQFRALLEAAPDAMLVINTEGRIRFVNAQAESLFGYSRADLHGQAIEVLIPPRHLERHVSHRAHYMRRPTVRSMGAGMSLFGLHRDGREIPIDVSLSPFQTDAEALVVAAVRDITQRRQTEYQLTRQSKTFETFYEIALELFNHRDVDGLLSVLVERAARLLEVDHVMISILEDDDTLLARAATPGHPIQAGQRSRRVGGALRVDTRLPVVTNISPEQVEAALADGERIPVAICDVPIFRDSTVIGLLSLVREQPKRTFDEGDLREANLLAQMIGLAWENARLYQEAQHELGERQRAEESLQKQNRYLSALHEITLELLNRRDLNELLQTIVERASQLLNAPYSELMLLENDVLVVKAYTANQAFLKDDRVERGQAQLSWQAFDTLKPAVIDDYSAWASRRPLYDPIQLSAVASIPIVAGQKCLGVLDLARAVPDVPFDPDQLQIAGWLAQLAALVLENAHLYVASQSELAERRRIEQELQAQRDFALQVMNTMGQGLVITNAKGEYEYVNPSAGKLVGIDPEAAIGRSAYEFVIPEDHVKLDEGRAARLRGEAYAYEVRVRRADGGEVFGLVTSVPRQSPTGTYGGSIAVLTDLTERRQAERAVAEERSRLRSLIESSCDGILFVGLDLMVRVINAPALRLLHLPGQPDDWQNRSIVELLSALRHQTRTVAQALVTGIRRVQQGDLTPSSGHYDLPPYCVEWLNLPVISGATSLGRLLRLRDITQERLAEKLRDDITHMMVHDLRNPVTGILASLELLEMDAGLLSADGRQVLSVAQQSGEQLLNLVMAILDINRLESGSLPFEPQQLALAVVVKDVLTRQKVVANTKQLQIEQGVPATLPFVLADRSLLERVFQNLIGNAIKFTPVNGRVWVKAKVSNSDLGWLEVSVSNTGNQIPPELNDRLFQKFAVGRQPGSGSGLGLAFCRLAIEAHGGRIWLDSESEHQIIFKFTLPIAQ